MGRAGQEAERGARLSAMAASEAVVAAAAAARVAPITTVRAPFRLQRQSELTTT